MADTEHYGSLGALAPAWDEGERNIDTDEIYERVWNEKAINTDTIMVHVRNIRDKIEINPRDPKYLKVVWGVGLSLIHI